MINYSKKGWLPEIFVISVALVFAVIGCIKAVTATTTTIGASIVTSGTMYATSSVVDGAATFDGAVTLGDAAADAITINGIIGSSVGFMSTTSPAARISLAGAAGGTTPLILVSSSTAAFATTTVFAIGANGDASFYGNVTLGSDSNDAITLNGKVGTITMNNASTISNPSSGVLSLGADVNVGGYATTTSANGNFATRGAVFASSTLIVDGLTTIARSSSTLASFGGGTTVSGLLFGTCSLTFSGTSFAAASATTTTCTSATGVTTDYKVFVDPLNLEPSIVFGFASSTVAGGAIQVFLYNASSTGAITVGSHTWNWMAIK